MGLGGGSSSEGAGTTSGGGSFNGWFNGAFAEIFNVASRASEASKDVSAANALRSDALDGLDVVAALGTDVVAPLGLVAVAARMAPRMASTCVAHDWVASARIAERVNISGWAIGDTGRTGVVIERSPQMASISRDAGFRTNFGRWSDGLVGRPASPGNIWRAHVGASVAGGLALRSLVEAEAPVELVAHHVEETAVGDEHDERALGCCHLDGVSG